MKQLPATAIRDLVEGDLLKSCDVLLMHTKHSPRAWLIRTGTHSYWNHALMVHVVEDANGGHDRTLIIDPKMSGLEVDEVTYYLQRPERYDAGVKRLEQGWFQNQEESSDQCCRDRVLQLALTKVTENLESGNFWRPVLKALRQIALPFHLGATGSGTANRHGIGAARVGKPMDVTAYTCSGFVQWCYYQSVCQIPGESGMDKSRLQEVIFNPHIESQVTSDYQLLSTTPADLAASNKLSWKYIIKDGVVWEVSSGEEVNLICEPVKNKMISTG